eukprot:13456825-Heterocapsa_arctica.AAC.1
MALFCMSYSFLLYPLVGSLAAHVRHKSLLQSRLRSSGVMSAPTTLGVAHVRAIGVSDCMTMTF